MYLLQKIVTLRNSVNRLSCGHSWKCLGTCGAAVQESLCFSVFICQFRWSAAGWHIHILCIVSVILVFQSNVRIIMNRVRDCVLGLDYAAGGIKYSETN